MTLPPIANSIQKGWTNHLEKLQVKLALPSKLPIMYLESTSKLTLIKNCKFCFGNVLRVHLPDRKAGFSYAPKISVPLASIKFFKIN